ncbi:EamA family transporter [Ornithinimicrobium pekingense]|uniref:Membrane protein n=1 Tax=Ornithinimicrobium pekingense TaxID=384677 RepID=A0ABQ2F8K5_9MICO|nr:DMT family transporter [Ornithinimicrobium pekingense]GGK71954.1 membrane protein [Ornithinimicrobium pekingense]
MTAPTPTRRRPTPTTPRPARSPRALLVLGLLIALVSALAFGSSGAVAKSSFNAGWSPAAAVTARMALGALVLAVPAALSMRGRWHLLRRRTTWVHVGLFGALAVAGAQLFYFLAVTQLSVGVALMLEYLGPILVVGWLWLAHGQRPRRLTLLGGGVAMLGLLLVLDVLGDVQVSTLGVVYGLLAAVGLAVFFVLGADESNGLPPIAFSALGMAVGTLVVTLAGLVGVVPFTMTTADATLAGLEVPWWVPMLWLGVVAAAFAYATGIIATRMLRAKVASFVGLVEVLFAVLWAWVLLGEMPAPVQLAGGLLIVAGVVAVKLDEQPEVAEDLAVEPIPAAGSRG